MLKIREAIVVEGLHDKIKLQSVVDAVIITTNGFSIYSDKEKITMLRRIAQERGLIVLTDSDSAGFRIRAFLKSIIGDIPIKHAYIPRIPGKERRKPTPGAEGMLGVEGMTPELLEEVLTKIGCASIAKDANEAVSKVDFYEYGLTGGNASASLRRELAVSLGLPPRLSANAFLEIINSLYSYSEFIAILSDFLSQRGELRDC